jgi:hypothetical protein
VIEDRQPPEMIAIVPGNIGIFTEMGIPDDLIGMYTHVHLVLVLPLGLSAAWECWQQDEAEYGEEG